MPYRIHFPPDFELRCSFADGIPWYYYSHQLSVCQFFSLSVFEIPISWAVYASKKYQVQQDSLIFAIKQNPRNVNTNLLLILIYGTTNPCFLLVFLLIFSRSREQIWPNLVFLGVWIWWQDQRCVYRNTSCNQTDKSTWKNFRLQQVHTRKPLFLSIRQIHLCNLDLHWENKIKWLLISSMHETP